MTFTIAEDIKTLLTDNWNPYNVANIDDNLIFYMNFESNTKDWSGRGLHGTKSATTAYIAGNVGNTSVDFNPANDDGIAIDSPAMLTSTNGNKLSFSFWLYYEGTRADSGDYYFYLGDGETRLSAGGIGLHTTANDGSISLNRGATNLTWSYAAGYHNKWTHVVITINFDGTATSVGWYFDNVEDTGGGSPFDWGTRTFPTDNASISLGYPNIPSPNKDDYAMAGYLDEFRIYNKILSTTEIDNLFNKKNTNGTTLINYTSTTDPSIRLKDNDPFEIDGVPAYPDNGEIIIGREQFLRIDPFNGSRTETFLVDIDVSYADNNDSTILKQILAEIDRVFDAESLAHTSYYYKPRYDWLGSYRTGHVRFQVEVMNALVVRPSLV